MFEACKETVALVEEKNGGPYSKDEREKRQNEVFRLHFEFGYPATKIADLMKINRNTINSDIKYWYSTFKDELKQDRENFILKQIGRLEAQRTRIVEYISENKIDDVRYEKILLDIDTKINTLVLRINSNHQTDTSEIKEEEIKDIILFLIIKYCRNYNLKKEIITSEIVNIKHCTMGEAENVFSQLEKLGLGCIRKFKSSEFVYDLLEFAYLRRYVAPNDEFIIKIRALDILGMHHDAEIKRLGKKFSEKYGSKEKWTDEIFEKHDDEESIQVKKFADTSSKIITEALETISNQDQIEDYLKYLGVFFGKEDKTEFEYF